MVYSGIFSGTVLMITFFSILATSLTILDFTYDFHETVGEAQDIENTMLETEISIDSITAIGNSNIVDATFDNTGEIAISRFEKFSVIATYDADIAGVKTRISETFEYNKANSFQSLSESEQFARPNNDASKGNWIDTVGGNSNGDLFDEVNESTRSDTNYSTSDTLTILGQTDVWEADLSSVDDPLNHNDHILRYVYRTDTGAGITMDLHVSLLDDGNPIASWTHNDIAETFTLATNTLSTTQAELIGNDYDLLSLELTMEYAGGLVPFKAGHISWAELQIPNANCAPSLSSGQWLLDSIDNDLVEPRILNPEETANICLELSNPLYDDGMLILVISTDRGITSMRATSWT